MQQLTPMFGSGVKYHLPSDKVEDFKNDFGDEAEAGHSFRTKDGQSYTIPASQVESFKADFPDAEPTRRMSFATDDGKGMTKDMTVSELRKLYDGDYATNPIYKADIAATDRANRERMDAAEKSAMMDQVTLVQRKQEEAARRINEQQGGGLQDTLAEKAHQNLSDAGGTALGRTGLGFIEKSLRFLGMAGADIATFATGRPYSERNNFIQKAADKVAEFKDAVYPEGPQGDSKVAQGIGKANELGVGLAEFAMTPTWLLAGNSFAEGWTQTYDTAKANGADDQTAGSLANARGAIDAGVSVAFKKMPTNRLLKGLGIEIGPGAKTAGKMVENAFKAKNSATAGVAKEMLFHAAKSAAEMGVLTDFQGIYDDAIMQMAEKGTDDPSEVDWAGAASRALPDAGKQAAMGAVLGLLPTVPRVAKARKAIDANQRESLSTKAGRAAFAELNPQGAESLVKSLEKEGKVSRKAAREAGLPDMPEADRNAIAAEYADARKSGQDKMSLQDPLKVESDALAAKNERIATEEKMAKSESSAMKRENDAKSLEGSKQKAIQKKEMEEYERQEQERIAREKAEEAAAPELSQEQATIEAEQARSRSEVEANEPGDIRDEQWPEYQKWLASHKGRIDGPKNWNKFVMESELDPSLKVDTSDQAAYDAFRTRMESERSGVEKQTRKPYDYGEEAGAAEEARGSRMAMTAESKELSPNERMGHVRFRGEIAEPTETKATQQETPESFRSPENRIKPRGARFRHHGEETKAPEKVPDGKGKMVDATVPEKPVAETPEQFRERVKDDPVLKRIDSEMKKAKTAAEKNALTEQFKKRVAELKTDGQAKQSGQTEPVSPKKAENTQPTKKRNGERFRIVDEVNEALRRHEPGEKSGEAFDEMFAKWKKLQQRIRVREENLTGDFRDPAEMKKERELSELKKEAKQLQRDMENAGVDTGKTVQFKIGENGTYTVKDNPFALRVFREKMSKSHLSVEGSDRIEKLRSNEDVISWAKKNGREIIEGKATTGTVNDYLKDQVKKAKEVTKRLFRDADVEVKDREWDPELDGDGLKSVVSDDGIIKELDNGDTITLFRAMQLGEDGQLRPPMSGKVQGKWREGEPVGVWQRAEERPDLVDKDGNFTLNKGKKSIKAKYNPYFHASDMPLNDQFAEAYKRPELVVVEVEIPKSELTSGYRAEKAKDSVGGPMRWKGGPVDNALNPEDRRGVYLSRYTKIKRVVPTEEAAKMIAERLKGKGVSVPDNVVTPNMRAALEANGVTISKSGKVQYLRTKEGSVVGTFDPETKKVTLYRGADAKTVFHELVGHGVEDWASRNNEKLHGKLMDLAKEAPESMLADIRRKYPDADEATIAKEIIARFAEGKGLENIKLKDAPKNWFAKAYTTVRDAILGFIEKMGGNRIDLEKIEEMTPIEAMDYITKQIGKGKTLGEIGGKYTGKMGLGEKWANSFYDRFTSVYKVSKEAGDAKTIQKGKEAEFQVKKFDPKKNAYGDILKKNDVASETVSEYLKAEGAIDRYERLKREAEAEGKEFDPRKAGGIDIEEARRTLAEFDKLPAERLAKIKEAVNFMRDLQHEGLMERVRAGLISAEEARAFEEAEPNHVPLRSAIDEHGEYVGGASGRGMNSPEFKKAEGRFTESGDPVAWMFEEYADAHTRAIENDTRVALARAVAADPSIGSIETNPELKEQRVKGGEGLPNAVKFKEVKDGKSMTRTILLNGERGSAIASAYTNRNLKRMPAPVQAFMRLWSSTATEWSPTFAFRNAIADNVDVASVVLAEKGVKEGGAWIKDFWMNKNPLRKEIWSFVRDGKIADGSTLDQYVKEGGMIGGFQREGYEGAKSAFSADTIAKEIKKGKSATNAVLTFIPKYVKAFNSYVELMTRVAAFKTNLDRGMSPKESAIWSRRISVDFNRKGNVTPVTNTLFMFSNSTIGATMRQLEAMKVGSKTWKGRRAMAAIAGLGVIEALAEHYLNLDDDEREAKGLSTRKDIIEHHRQTMLGVSKGDTMYGLKVHDDPLMTARFYANLATRYFLNKGGDNNGVNGRHVYEEIRDGIIENIPKFFGMGGKTMEAGWSTWMPTAIQPIVQDIDNKDFKGQDIRRKKFNESVPWSYNGRKSTPGFYKAISESINNATGGSDSRKGSVDIAPETLKHYLTSTTKNMGTDIVNTVNLVANFITGDFGNVDSRSVPFARDLHRKTETSDNRYFELVRKYDADKYEFDHKRREWSMDERKSYSERHPWIRKGADGRTRVQKLKTQIDDLRRREGGEAKGSSGTWHKVEMTDERKEQLKARRLELQGKVIKLMESMDR